MDIYDVIPGTLRIIPSYDAKISVVNGYPGKGKGNRIYYSGTHLEVFNFNFKVRVSQFKDGKMLYPVNGYPWVIDWQVPR